MKISKNSLAGFSLALICMLFLPFLLRAEEAREYIAIRKQGAGRIAVVLDRTAAKSGKESEWARSIDGTIRSGLDFTGIFNLLPAPMNMRSMPGGPLNFGALNSVGAEIYTGGTMTKQSGQVNLNMEVYDALSGKQLMKKQYSGAETQLRSMGLRFCVDLVELLTGNKCLLFGSKISFVSTKSGFKEIYMCDFDGQNVVQLTNTRSISLTPAVSPDGNYIAWTDYTSGRPDLYIRNLATKATASVGKPGVSIDPSWRNGSNELATTLSFEGDQEIYLVRPNGTISRRLTFSRGIDVSPSFSPDGSKMAFVSQRSGMPQIFVQDLQGGAARRLTFSGNYNTQPSWSPGGDKIVYSSLQKNGEINIFIVNADGSGLLQLTRGARDNESPSWSPDGRMIAFMSNRQGRKKLFVMNADGSNQRALFQMDGDQQQPSWSIVR
ncbi:MAG: Tol-Pal system beta propeller repeat protein TolB [Chlorobiaceae bacterium]|nr:Tol-Pal system beta propeller repeat protein TolB [Chlorobiaceae bacterium]NTW74236.1 Tol-Pal system beta propeller repeat protein TolB [Chlorobiaceae bacterium]